LRQSPEKSGFATESLVSEELLVLLPLKNPVLPIEPKENRDMEAQGRARH
jgi:hypothetical protein